MIRKIIDLITGKAAAERQAMEVMDRFFEAKRAYDAAKARRDSRDMHWTGERLTNARTEQLRVELGL